MVFALLLYSPKQETSGDYYEKNVEYVGNDRKIDQVRYVCVEFEGESYKTRKTDNIESQ